MHQLGAVSAEKLHENIKHVLSARRKLYNAGIALLECDDTYAAQIKAELERLKISSHFIPFAGIPYVRQVAAYEIQTYLETARRIYLRPEQITIDPEKKLCRIELYPHITANVPIVNKVAVKSILV